MERKTEILIFVGQSKYKLTTCSAGREGGREVGGGGGGGEGGGGGGGTNYCRREMRAFVGQRDLRQLVIIYTVGPHQLYCDLQIHDTACSCRREMEAFIR